MSQGRWDKDILPVVDLYEYVNFVLNLIRIYSLLYKRLIIDAWQIVHFVRVSRGFETLHVCPSTAWTKWWFQIFLCSSQNLGKWSKLTSISYDLDWLVQPPTRKPSFLIRSHCFPSQNLYELRSDRPTTLYAMALQPTKRGLDWMEVGGVWFVGCCPTYRGWNPTSVLWGKIMQNLNDS